MHSLSVMGNVSLHLREATSEDAHRVYTWRNDLWIVSLSSSQRPVAWEAHRIWFQRAVEDPNWMLFIIECDDGVGAGTVRLERRGDLRALVTIYLLRAFTGRGLGVQALSEACSQGFSRWPLETVHAYIREDNRPSLSAFAKAGFIRGGPSLDCPAGHWEMVLRRS